MNQAVSTISSSGYRRIVKPILFTRQPDAVHSAMLDLAVKVQRRAWLLRALDGAWAYQNPEALAQTYNGMTFKNPVGLSAGFDKNIQLAPLLKAIGFGFMEGGSVTYHHCDGNPRPWFYRLPAARSLVVHAGLGNEGSLRAYQTIRAYQDHLFDDFPLNVSIAKTNAPTTVSTLQAVQDYTASIHRLQSLPEVSMFTLNISCPNAFGGEAFTTPGRLDQLLRTVEEMEISQPIFIKMPSDLEWRQFKKLLAVADKHVVAGVTICNLAKGHARARLRDQLPEAIPGGLSGKPTWELSNRLIRDTYRAYGDRFTIIGVGGIFSAEDAYTKITLGANLVELITGMIFEGPQLIGRINKGLVQLLRQDGFTTISQAVGSRAHYN